MWRKEMRRKVLMAAAFFLATSDYCAATKPTPIPLEEQIRIFTQRIAENPNNRGAYHHARAKVYGNLGDYEKAFADYEQAIKFGGSDYHVYFDRANLYLKRVRTSNDDAKAIGDYEKAITDYAQGLAICPSICDEYSEFSTYPAYMDRAAIHVVLGRYALAIKDYKSASAIRPFLPEPYRNLADIYVKFGDYDAAIKCYNDEIEHTQVSLAVSPYTKRAELYESLGDYDKALADIKRACVETDLLACSAFRQFQERHGQ